MNENQEVNESQIKTKHIKIQVEDHYGKLYVRIIRQTNGGSSFGVGEDEGKRRFTASNGFWLCSFRFPHAIHNRYLGSGLFVRGGLEESDRDYVLIPSQGWLDKLRVAVAEYNQEPKIIETIE